MLMAKVVCEVLRVSPAWLARASRELGVGKRVGRQGMMYGSGDIDRLKAYRERGN